jgi:hypothetical protein
MTNPNQKLEDMNWFQKMDLIRDLSVLPALPTMALVRTKVGFRLLTPGRFFAITGTLAIGSTFLEKLGGPYSWLMPAYAVASLGMGLYQRRQRWLGLCNSEKWHSRSPGISYLERLPLPKFLRLNRRANRFLEPIAIAIIAVIAFLLCHLLGLWLMVSALGLTIYEQTLWEKTVDHFVDVGDQRIATEVMAEMSQHYDGPPTEAHPSLEDTAGLPVGLAPDIMRAIAMRTNLAPIPGSRIAA